MEMVSGWTCALREVVVRVFLIPLQLASAALSLRCVLSLA